MAACVVCKSPRGDGGSSSSSSRSSSSISSSSRDGSASDAEATDRASAGEAPGVLGCFAASLRLCLGRSFTSAARLKAATRPATGVSAKALTAENRGKRVEECVDIDHECILGAGGCASVYAARDLRTGAPRAVKCVVKSLMASEERLRREVDVMLALDHPNVLRLYDVFEDRRLVFLVLELCAGGDLFDRLAGDGPLPEAAAAQVMQQLFRAVAHLHATGVCHRDVKPENLFLKDPGPIEDNEVKLGDFGIAAAPGPEGGPMTTKTGTPQYVAPEVLAPAPSYGRECDLWSCGVLMYLLLSQRLPFRGADEASTLRSVLAGRLAFPAAAFAGVSEEAKRLVRRLMALNPRRRCTAEEALRDPWTLAWAPAGAPRGGALEAPLAARLCDFRAVGPLKQAALRVVARHLDAQQLRHLSAAFSALDADGSGTISIEELERELQAAGVAGEHTASVAAAVDSDGNGKVDYSEFLAGILDRRHYLEETACWAAFRVFDLNDDGLISKQELAKVLRDVGVSGTFRGSADKLLREADLNDDGYIDFEEFVAMLRA